MSALNILLGWEPIRRLASGSLLLTFLPVGSPFVNPSRGLIVCNNTNQLVTFSIDGVNDYLDFVAGACMILDTASLKQADNQCWSAKGTQVYARSTVSGSPAGNFCVTNLF